MIRRWIPNRQMIEEWTFRKSPPHALAFFRIAFGAFLLFYWGGMILEVPMRFSTAGLLFPLHDSPLLSFIPSPVIAYIPFLLILFCFFCIMIGAHMRIATLSAFILYVYYQNISLHLFGTSYDRIFMVTLLVLAVSGADRTFSYAMRQKYGTALEWEYISVLPQRLIALQITFVYLGVGYQKIWLPGWKTGEILYYAFIGRWGTPLAYWFAAHIPMVVFDWLLYTTKAFELLIPFGLWIRPVQKWFFLGGALFHTLITITLSIWWFMFLLPSYVIFLEPEAVYELWEKRWKKRILPKSSARVESAGA